MTDYKFKTEPFEHQRIGFNQTRDLEAAALFMEMGTGKSKLLIDTAAYLFQQGKINGMVVVAPKTICLNWVHGEIPLHMPESVNPRVVLYNSRLGAVALKDKSMIDRTFPKDSLRLNILVINIEALQSAQGPGERFVKRFLATHDILLVVDESTTIKSPTARRTKTMLKLADDAKYRRIASGSPMTNSPMDLYTQFKFLDDTIFGNSFVSFRNRYAVVEEGRRAGNVRYPIVTGYQNLNELEEIIKPWIYRVTKDECLDLPPEVFQTREFEMTPKQKHFYDQVRDESIVEIELAVKEAELARLEGKQGVPPVAFITAQMALQKMIKLHQIACGWVKTDAGEIVVLDEDRGTSPRIQALLDTIEESGDENKVIIWCNYTFDIQRVTAQLRKVFGEDKVEPFYGALTMNERKEVMTNIQDDSHALRFFVGQPMTGGRGLNFTKAPLMIYYSNNYDLDMRLQSEDRMHRIGQERTCLYVDLIAPGTVDQHIINCLKNKVSLAGQVGFHYREWF